MCAEFKFDSLKWWDRFEYLGIGGRITVMDIK